MNPDKRIIIDDLTARVNASPFLIVVDYTSITVPEFTNLRSALAACGAQCHVAKNTGEIRNNVANITAQTQNSVESASQAKAMVELQTKAVEEVIAVFREMQERMGQLIEGLKDIVVSTEKADGERSAAVAAVKNISDIIEETAGSAETVNDVANKLLNHVEKLSTTASVLDENMEGLKNEISVFKI